MLREWLPGPVGVLFLLVGACSAAGGTGDGGQVEPPPGALACLVDADCGWVMVASHRGYHLELTENSLAALRAAVTVGASFVEVDVRPTSDEVLVLMHDSDVDRTTDGTGALEAMTWEEVQELTLRDGVEDDPESLRVPRFSEALGLARDLGAMLYVDVKTPRTDLVLADIQAGGYHDVALVYDDLETVASLVARDPDLLVMPASVANGADLAAAQAAIPGLVIVEMDMQAPDPDLVSAIRAAGLKAQQDCFTYGDLRALTGDYTGWKEAVETGIFLPQTDYPHLLAPAVDDYNRTGDFPEDGPGVL